MHNKISDKRIYGTALEMIMRDVLDGMFDFTSRTCRGSETAGMEIVAVEKTAGDAANSDRTTIIPFPAKRDAE